jgi:PAS domain S-box-containing protein
MRAHDPCLPARQAACSPSFAHFTEISHVRSRKQFHAGVDCRQYQRHGIADVRRREIPRHVPVGSHLKVGNKAAASLAIAILLLALGVAALLWSFGQIGQAAEARRHAYAVITATTSLLSDLRDAETGQRGYSLTGNEAFLEPYLAVRDGISVRLQELRRLTSVGAANARLDAVAPLIGAKMAEMAYTIELRRNHELTAALSVINSLQGKRLMDSIRVEMSSLARIEEEALAGHEAGFQSNMRRLFASIVAASLAAVALALFSVWLVYRQTRQRVAEQVHLETAHLLEIQEATNIQLRQTNVILRDSEEKLAVTLDSIGDAVIGTDADARVTRLNPVAEQLTGWTHAEACGRPVDEVFHIINQETRQPATIPVMETLEHGTIQGLANHTVLIARDGSECAIADSCAPIRDRDNQVVGAVLVFRNVTGEYAAQQALRDSAALIQTILNTVVDGVITIHAAGGIVETANPAAEQMFGYSAAELVGQSLSLLIPELDRGESSPSLDYYSASDEARASGLGREIVGRRKDGSTFPLEIAVSEMWLGSRRYFTGILRDITARKQAEEALLKAGALQSAIFNSANFSSIATDARGVIQIFNVGAEHMLGYAAADVMNKITPADISDPWEVVARAAALSTELGTTITPGFEALVFKASRGIEDIYELTYIRKDGSRFPAVVSVTALRDDEGAIIGYLLIGTDNTARKQVEAERARLDRVLLDKNAELEVARFVAENANLAKSDFLSSMSHELRTPLSAILGFAQLMESGSPAPTISQKRSIDQILKAGWYLLELINEILDLAVIESGKLSLSVEPVSLSDVMLECETMVEPQAQKRGISVSFPPIGTHYFVKADRTRVKQVVINLLSNAIKYNRPGGSVAVVYSPSPPDSIRISVRDTGAGLAPDQLVQLFQPFNRLGQKANVEEGTGIGLVVCKRLVELMDGVIGVESTVGEGSVFWFDLKLTTEAQLTAHAAEPAPVDRVQALANAQLHTLLYVEDNPANLMLVEDLIARRPDIRLLSARDGIRGVELALASMPDVILMDINLPGISGVKAMRMLAEHAATAHIPVVALSANAMPRDMEKGLEAGFFRYLTKPIKVSEFMETLDVALKFAASDRGLTDEKEQA